MSVFTILSKSVQFLYDLQNRKVEELNQSVMSEYSWSVGNTRFCSAKSHCLCMLRFSCQLGLRLTNNRFGGWDWSKCKVFRVLPSCFTVVFLPLCSCLCIFTVVFLPPCFYRCVFTCVFVKKKWSNQLIPSHQRSLCFGCNYLRNTT